MTSADRPTGPNAPSLHRVQVRGEPAAFATAEEAAWRKQLAQDLSAVTFDPRGAVLTLDFVVSARQDGPLGPSLDALAEPVVAIAIGNLGWFGRRRHAVRGLWVRKRVGTPVGCDVSVYAGWVRAPAVGSQALLDATWRGALPRSGRDLTFARWVGRELQGVPSPGSRVAVRLTFAGTVSLADISTGQPKHVIDGLWPVLGGAPGAPDDARITLLGATQGEPVDGSVHVLVLSQGQTRPTPLA